MKFQNKRMIRTALRPYLGMLGVLLVLEILVSQFLLNILERETIARNEVLAEQLMENVESCLTSVEANLLNMAMSTRIVGFLQTAGTKDGGADVMRMSELQNFVPNGIQGEGVTTHYALYCANVNGIVTDSTVYLRLRDVYEKLLCADGMDYEKWHAEILDARYYFQILPAQGTAFGDFSRERVLFIHSITEDANRRLLGQVMAYLDAESLEKLLEPALEMGACVVTVSTPQNGQIAFASGPEYTGLRERFAQGTEEDWDAASLLGESVIVTNKTSGRYGLKYSVIVPRRTIGSQVRGVQLLMGGYAILMLLIGGVLALVNAWRHSQPLQRLAWRLKLQDGDMSQIDRAVTGMLCKQEQMQGELEGQIGMLRAANCYRLISGGFADERELYSELPVLRQFDGMVCGAVVQLCPFGWEEDEEARRELSCAVLYDALDALPVLAFRVQISRMRIAVGLHCMPEQAQTLLAQMARGLREEYGIFVRAGVGEAVEHMLEIGGSVRHAGLEVDRGTEMQEQLVSRYAPEDGLEKGFVLGAPYLEKLNALTIAGEYEQIAQLLDALYQKNYQEIRISALQNRLLLSALTDAMLRQLENSPGVRDQPDQYRALYRETALVLEAKTPELAFGQVRQIYEKVCEIVNERKRSHNRELAERIRNYLDTHYADDGLCLTSVGEVFNLNERYLSTFFREQLGESFTGYLMRIRMDMAKTLLLESELPIVEIAERVGYANVDTFRKAYKRYTGSAPSALRSE